MVSRHVSSTATTTLPFPRKNAPSRGRAGKLLPNSWLCCSAGSRRYDALPTPSFPRRARNDARPGSRLKAGFPDTDAPHVALCVAWTLRPSNAGCSPPASAPNARGSRSRASKICSPGSEVGTAHCNARKASGATEPAGPVPPAAPLRDTLSSKTPGPVGSYRLPTSSGPENRSERKPALRTEPRLSPGPNKRCCNRTPSGPSWRVS